MPASATKPHSRAPWSACWAALAFLTVWPTAARQVPTDDPTVWGRAVACYPLVGAAVGALQALSGWGWQQIGLPWPGVVAVLIGVLATGALHLDGVMDAADGLWGGVTPEERLRIMRDERVGAFGVLAALFVVLLKVSLYTPRGAWLAPVLGRWAVALAVVRYPYARQHGLGRALKEHARGRQALWATLFTALLVLPWDGAGAWALAAGAAWLTARYALQRLPGLTGDIYGALVEVAEIAALAFWALRD